MTDIKEQKDLDLLIKATECCRDFVPIKDLEFWITLPGNLMFTVDENVGLATLEYPGVYSVHWYFDLRGRPAINLAREMVANLFENYGARAVRGLIKTRLRASRWACRQVGMKSLGFLTFEDGEENELFVISKDDFMKKDN